MFSLYWLFIYSSFSQEIVQIFDVNLNSNGWLSWDVRKGSFIFFDETIKEWSNCTLGETPETCKPQKSGYGVDSALLTSENLFIVDYKQYDLMRKYILAIDDAGNQPFYHNSLPKNYDFGYRSAAATDSYFYLYQIVENKRVLHIYGNDWGIFTRNLLPKLHGTLDDKSTGWFIKKDGIYTFDKIENSTFLSKRQSDGSIKLWKRKVPLCDSSVRLLIASCYPFVYTVCTPLNIIQQFEAESGENIKGSPINTGDIESIECSSDGLFILYNDAKIDQYGCDLTYIYTYYVDNKKILPFFSDIKISNGFLLYILCDVNSQSKCASPKIYKWKTFVFPCFPRIKETSTTSIITYSTTLETWPWSTADAEESESLEIPFSSTSISETTRDTPIHGSPHTSNKGENTILIVSISVPIIVIFGFVFFQILRGRQNTLINETEFNIITTKSVENAETDTSSVIITRIFAPEYPVFRKEDFSSETDSTSYTTTVKNTTALFVTNTNLSIPGYKIMEFGKDFDIVDKLASGGFGEVYTGILKSPEIVDRNNGEKSCVIKRAFSQDMTLFFQELSICELFTKHSKYFSQLLCYSQNPALMVFKFYNLGSLYSLLFYPEKNPLIYCKYNFKLAVRFSVRISQSLREMHAKGFLHNDLKPDNILLASDKEEELFPVLSDFGSIEVLDTANVIHGLRIMKSQSATPDYCAPEVLVGYKNNKRISSIQTDVYACGIVFLELFTRRRAWNKFTTDYVIKGGLPDLSLKNFFDNLNGVTKETILQIMKIVVECIDCDPSKRPSLDSIILLLKNLEVNL